MSQNTLVKTPLSQQLLSLNMRNVNQLFPGFAIGDFAAIYGATSVLSLTSLLCVGAQLPAQLGGLGSNVVFVDGGNTFRLYQVARLARLQQLDPKHTLERIYISRAFTAYQMTALILKKLRETVKHDYPPIPYKELEIPLWSFSNQEDYVKKQIEYHLTCPMICPNHYRWKKSDTWAVKKKGKQRAERVLESEAEAKKWMKENRGDFIEHRKGECVRCEHYCKVRTVCEFSSCFLGDKNG